MSIMKIKTYWKIGFFLIAGEIPWLLIPELFTSDFRAKASSIALFFNWTCNLIMLIAFPFVEAAIKCYSFIVFGVIAACFATYVFFFLPETKNKPIEQIVASFNEKFIFSIKGD